MLTSGDSAAARVDVEGADHLDNLQAHGAHPTRSTAKASSAASARRCLAAAAVSVSLPHPSRRHAIRRLRQVLGYLD